MPPKLLAGVSEIHNSPLIGLGILLVNLRPTTKLASYLNSEGG